LPAQFRIERGSDEQLIDAGFRATSLMGYSNTVQETLCAVMESNGRCMSYVYYSGFAVR
jgi:hypothetical protein